MSQSLSVKCACSHCGTHLEFPLEIAGTVVPCPHCEASTELTYSAPPQDSNTLSPSEVLSAFIGPIAKTRVSVFYQAGLVLVTGMLLLLPVVYLALIGAAIVGVVRYASNFSWLASSFRGGVYVYLVKIVLYVGPLFAGTVMVFFLIKPLCARRLPHAQPLALNPALEPALFTFIAKICELTGAPMPQRIDLDCELNAAAAFRRGFRSLFSNDLVLVIGLPLVAGLNVKQFAGVMAHEFGHFTQGFGMRLSYTIRRINSWFARLVYQRDQWDAWLEENGMEAEHWTVLLVFNFARFAVWCSRLVLKAFMYTAHALSCYLLRQMEYDADRYQIHLVGSVTFEETTHRLALLAKAEGAAYKEMRTTWNLSRALPADIPAYLLAHAAQVPAHVQQHLHDTLGLSKTGVFDTHPCAADRIRQARQAQEPGVFHLDHQASALFSHFDIVSQQVSHLHYTDTLGLNLLGAKLRPTE